MFQREDLFLYTIEIINITYYKVMYSQFYITSYINRFFVFQTKVCVEVGLDGISNNK